MSSAALGGINATRLSNTTAATAAAPNASADAGGSVANPYATLNSGDFVELMLTELTNQDPFEPTDTKAILDQVSGLRDIESSLQLQTTLEDLTLSNGLASAGTLIGKPVTGLDLSNDELSGTVRSVRLNDGTPTLALDSGRTLPLDRVTQIGNAATDADPDAGATANATAPASVP